MNTVKKGDKFELDCFEIISNAINSKQLATIPEFSKLYQKKGYYSRDRGSEIIFDLSIEVWLPRAPKYSLLYLIECKNYSKPVPVNDLEEFYAKIAQVSGANVKGVFITTNTFQSGAHKYADSKGIMLIEVNENLTYNIILYKTNRHSELQGEQIGLESIPPDLSECIQFRQIKRRIERNIISSFTEYAKKHLHLTKCSEPNKLSRERIDEISSQLINSFDVTVQRECRYLSFDKLTIYLKEVFGLSIKNENITELDENGRKILSECCFRTKTITIDRSISQTNRYNFILAHEIGHFILHNKLQIDQSAYEKMSDSSYNFMLDKHLLINPRNWIEWQANQFASSLIMPEIPYLSHLSFLQNQVGLREGSQLYVDDQKRNLMTFYSITSSLAERFNTSKTSAIYRLKSLNMLKENFKTKSIGQIISEILDN